MVDEAFLAMGGFGKVQKLSYVLNTLAEGGAAFMVYCFSFLEKMPVLLCEDEHGNFQECDKEDYCNLDPS